MLIGKTVKPMGSTRSVCICKRERLARWLTQTIVAGGCLAASQLITQPLMANEASQALPPIRLVSGTIHSNPFVAPSQSSKEVAAGSRVNLIQSNGNVTADGHAVLHPIRQTSDQSMSEIKLKSIGTAVGLLPIGAPATEHQPLVVEPAPVPQPKINPHAQPDYDRVQSNEMVMVAPSMAAVPQQHASVQTPPTNIPAEPVWQPAMQPVAEPVEAPAKTVLATPVDPAPSAVAATDSDSSEPIEFSLNDASGFENESAEDVSLSFSDFDEPSLDRSLASEVEEGAVADEVRLPEAVKLPEPFNITSAKKVELPATPVVSKETLPRLPLPVHINSPTSLMAEQAPAAPRMPVKIETPSSLESVKMDPVPTAPRHRAAVAVEAPPMVAVAKRKASKASTASRVSAAPIVPAALAGHRDSVNTVVASQQLPVDESITATVQCEAEDVTSLSVDGIIRGVTVDDESIAQVISTNSRHLRLIGIRPGTTRVMVERLEEGSQEPVREIYLLNIASAAKQNARSSQQEQSLMSVIEDKYRTASVQLTRQDDRILVEGACDSVEDAKQIVRLIRKTYLVPVEDQLIIR
ncbi:pilus assembly protein N-terminal domain-containing protein [Rhodopirellula halodulae]|uniref:pilus assembly protein N-terminal domain-containing protein n=1 Tax=Rhodopirellula halodulae TaxID=2894198 RepID=UPI001E3D7D49|nr:pilus assembly protein N-terminal domain-containing protein [Rhodopirellula sp. JC737]MCC9657312.1 pilus assembly protein N-terminal domain-containing protein [Rhodopirellula sp. JC737]